MIGLNTVLATLTGPRRLRSALRQKTVAINRLLDALDGPCELRVTIPAAVFGGDIFSVMSSQLREVLIVAQSAPAPQLNRERRRLNGSAAHPAFKNSENPFPLTVDRATSSTQLVSFNHELTARAALAQSESPTGKQSSSAVFSPPETRISRQGIEDALPGQVSAVSVKSADNLAATLPTKHLSTTATLVSSLNRYWQAVRETRDARHSQPQRPTDSPAHSASVPITEPEQRNASRPWPNLAGRDVSDKLRSFNTANPLQKSARLSSQPDRQIQNVFNIEVNHANQHVSNYDELGDRIAQILHEQALQHGIDVT